MQHLVTYQLTNGKSKRLFIEAETPDDIYETPGFSESVKSVYTIPFNLRLHVNKLSLDQQLLLVAQISTLVDSGAKISKGIEDIAHGSDFLKGFMNDPRLVHATTVSQYLKIFGVSNNILLLIKSGEESGQLPEAVNTATEALQQEIELKKAIGADLKAGLLYLILGLGSIFALSLALGNAAQTIIESPQLQATSATRILVALRDLQTNHTAIFLSSLFALAAGIKYLWNNVDEFRRLWPIKLFDALLKARRSASFLSAWVPLYISGLSPEKSLSLIARNYTGTNRKAVESILDGVTEGNTIPRSLDPAYWSPSLIVGIQAFDSAHDEARKNLLTRLKSLLITEIFVTGHKFSSTAKFIGMAAALFTTFLIAMGFYMPMILSRT